MKQNGSIQRHLAVRLLVLTFIIMMAAGAGIYLYVRATLWAQFDASLAAKARILSSLMKWEISGSRAQLNFEYPEGSMPEFGRGEHAEYFEFAREGGESIARSPSLGSKGALNIAGRSDRPITFSRLKLPDGRSGRAVVLRYVPPVEYEDFSPTGIRIPGLQNPPHMVLTLARESREVGGPLEILLSSLLAAAAAMCVSIVAAVLLTINRGLQPLLGVADAAAGINVQNLHYRFSVARMPRELQPICGRLNDLLGRLQTAFVRERRFSADVAHELRTPIAELRAMAEVALKWPADSESAARNAQDTLNIACQMEGVVTSLLALARCEAGAQHIVRESVDLSQALQSAWRPFDGQARDRGLSISFPAGPAGNVSTDKSLLVSVLANLFGNAVKYAPANGRITIEIDRQTDKQVILVGNSNATLTRDDLPHLFEPFWRKDAARTDGAHAGLGLSLVNAFSRSIGGEVRADLPAPNWFEIRLSVPCTNGNSH
jgi:signal transduction histidine kinase